MKKFDVHVIDDALDKDVNVSVCRTVVELNGKWAPPIDDLDIYWFDWDQDHPCKEACMTLLEIGGKYIDISSAIGYETWIRINTRPAGWHCDQDDRLNLTQNKTSYPLCSMVYYPFVADDLEGGRLEFEDGRIIEPKTNRLVVFGPGIRHNVEEDYIGDRISFALNPWPKPICQELCFENKYDQSQKQRLQQQKLEMEKK
jgi:hypothetical protein